MENDEVLYEVEMKWDHREEIRGYLCAIWTKSLLYDIFLVLFELFILHVALSYARSGVAGGAIVFFALFVFSVLFFPLSTYVIAKKAIKTNRIRQGTSDIYRFKKNEFLYENRFTSMRIPYSYVYRTIWTPKRILIYLNWSTCVIIRRKECSEEMQEFLRDRLKKQRRR